MRANIMRANRMKANSMQANIMQANIIQANIIQANSMQSIRKHNTSNQIANEPEASRHNQKIRADNHNTRKHTSQPVCRHNAKQT